MPGPMSGSGGKRHGFGLEQRLAQTSFEILASEAPGERLAESGVASAEGVQCLRQVVQARVVMWLEHFVLDNREVNFHQANANLIDWTLGGGSPWSSAHGLE